MSTIKVGDRVRVTEGCASVTPGEIFTVTRIMHSPNPYTWNGAHRVPDSGKPDWYAMGDKHDTGVWAQFLELAGDYSGAVDQIMFDLEQGTGDAETRVRAGLLFAYENGWGGVQ